MKVLGALRSNCASFGSAYALLLGISALFALGAIATLLPSPSAPWPNVLGYKSICPFAPAATFACALLAAICCTVRARLVRRAPSPAFLPVAAFLLLGAAFAWSTTAWAGEKAKYADATSAASSRP
jgi:hypothetical protein